LQDSYEPIAPFYDLEHGHFRADIDFYLRLFDPCPVLEVGVGTGRIALPLAEAGFDVWGVEPSQAMLELASRRLTGHGIVHLVRAALPALQLARHFPAAIMPLNVLWHLPDAGSQLKSLRAIRHHLDPGGLLCIDTSNPLTLADRGSDGDMRMRFTRSHEGGRVTCMSAAWDDEENQTIRLELIYDIADEHGAVTRSQTRLELRYAFGDELEATVREAGFQVRQIYGSYDLDPYDEESPNLIVVAQAG
jgi:SAM-dependent methyltransferase